MKNFAIVGLLFLCSCAGASVTTVSEIITEGWKVLRPHQDSLTVIRTYPSDIVEIACKKDTSVTLKSGDKIRVKWLGESALIAITLENDTIKIPLK